MKRGFTLVEAVIYAAILALISVLVISAVLTATKSFASLRASQRINNSAVTGLERMTREIRLASDFDIQPGRLNLDTAEIFLSSTTLMIKEGESDAQPLTSSKVEVLNLVFRRAASSTISKAVKVELEIQSRENSEKFYNTVILRGSY